MPNQRKSGKKLVGFFATDEEATAILAAAKAQGLSVADWKAYGRHQKPLATRTQRPRPATISPMPYKDPEKQRQAQAESYRRRYQASRKFRREEAERKAAWLETEEGKASNLAASLRAIEKAKAAKVTKIKPAEPPKSPRQRKARA